MFSKESSIGEKKCIHSLILCICQFIKEVTRSICASNDTEINHQHYEKKTSPETSRRASITLKLPETFSLSTPTHPKASQRGELPLQVVAHVSSVDRSGNTRRDVLRRRRGVRSSFVCGRWSPGEPSSCPHFLSLTALAPRGQHAARPSLGPRLSEHPRRRALDASSS